MSEFLKAGEFPENEYKKRNDRNFLNTFLRTPVNKNCGYLSEGDLG